MILDHKFEEGFEVLVIDKVNKREEALYWTDDFLQIRPQNNEFQLTKQMMQLTKDFVSHEFQSGAIVDKPSQIDLLNKSAQFFKERDVFDLEEYEKEVLQDDNRIASFRDYSKETELQPAADFSPRFEINATALKKKSNIFKSVLKLDKNFHIYIHGDRNLIEKGEENGKKFYKIYYEKEN